MHEQQVSLQNKHGRQEIQKYKIKYEKKQKKMEIQIQIEYNGLQVNLFEQTSVRIDPNPCH